MGLQYILWEAIGSTRSLQDDEEDLGPAVIGRGVDKGWFVEISPDKRTLIHSSAVIRHTLVPGTSSANLTTRTSGCGLRTDRTYIGKC
jgi:hypothetical protein